MNPNFNRLRQTALFIAGVCALTANSSSAPFGMVDAGFNSPRFTARCYPNYCFSDNRDGLLWTFVNTFSSGFVGANDLRVGALVRTTTNGIVDPNFMVGPGLRETIGIAVQADAKILVGGRMVSDLALNGAPNYRVFRLLTNGLLDATYHSPVFGSSPRFLTLQSDGKLLAACLSLTDTTAPNGGIVDFARLDSDGSPDTNFHHPVLTSGATGIFTPPVVDTNGAIYVGGGFSQVDGQGRQQIARLYPDGTLDPGFVPTGFTSSLFVRGILLQPGGTVVIAGRIRVNSTYYPLVRLNSDGSIDNSFTLVPSTSINFIRARLLRATADGKMLTVGTSMARFNTNGSLDNTFTRLPFVDAAGNPDATGLWFEQLADGRIVVPSDPTGGGPTSISGQPFNGAVRLLPDGGLDSLFSQPIFQQDNYPTSLARQSDQRLLVAGAFDHAGSTATASVARLNTNGTPDTSYAVTLSNVTSVLNLAPLQNDQTYALVQTADPVTLYTSNTLMRLQSDGTVDSGFNADPVVILAGDSAFSDLFLQGSYPILVGSSAQALLEHTNAPVARLLTNGSRDTNFQPNFALLGTGLFADGSPITDWTQASVDNIGSLVVGDVQLLAAEPDGKLLAAVGTNVSGSLYNYQLIQLNTNGTLDTSFNGAAFSPAGSVVQYPLLQDRFGNFGQVQATYPVRCLASAIIQSNGAILICGSFTNINSAFRSGIARFRSDWTLDNAFPVGTGPTTAGGLRPVKISGLSVDGTGKIWVTGNFVQWDGISVPGYVRLNMDGSVDTNCMPQCTHYAVDDYTLSSFSGALPRGANECYVFGPHLLPGDTWPRALSRLVRYPPPPLVPVGMLPGLGFRITFNSENGESYYLRTSADLRTWDTWLSFDGTGQQLAFTDPAALSAAQRFYRVQYQP